MAIDLLFFWSCIWLSPDIDNISGIFAVNEVYNLVAVATTSILYDSKQIILITPPAMYILSWCACCSVNWLSDKRWPKKVTLTLRTLLNIIERWRIFRGWLVQKLFKWSLHCVFFLFSRTNKVIKVTQYDMMACLLWLCHYHCTCTN